MEQMNITVEKIEPAAILPSYASAGAACFDLFASSVQKGERADDGIGYRSLTLNTGLKFDIPDGWVMRLYSRSGQGFNSDVRLCNSTGIIDSDYTGEVKVKLTADSRKGCIYLAELWDKIVSREVIAVCQGEIAPVEYVTFGFGVVDKETARGADGFGSTDKAAS